MIRFKVCLLLSVRGPISFGFDRECFFDDLMMDRNIFPCLYKGVLCLSVFFV